MMERGPKFSLEGSVYLEGEWLSCVIICIIFLISLKTYKSACLSSLLAPDPFSTRTIEDLHGGHSCTN